MVRRHSAHAELHALRGGFRRARPRHSHARAGALNGTIRMSWGAVLWRLSPGAFRILVGAAVLGAIFMAGWVAGYDAGYAYAFRYKWTPLP
jgi:hypothetical protein